MSVIFSLAGLVFVVSGLLSLFDVTDAGLDFVSRSQIHTLQFLSNYPMDWVYVGVGLVLLLIAGFFSRRR